MKEDTSFLPFLIDEEIYVVNDQGTGTPVTPDTNSDITGDAPDQYTGSTLVILDEKGKYLLSDMHYEFLIRILKSVHLNPEEVRFLYGEEASGLLMEHLEDCKVIVFSRNPADTLWKTPDLKKYLVQSVESNELLLADPLVKIYEDKALKRQLWECLKDMYRIS